MILADFICLIYDDLDYEYPHFYMVINSVNYANQANPHS